MSDTRIKSIFGTYSEKLQVMVDAKADAFAPLWFPRYFGWGTPSASLNYISIIGRSRVEAAASIVDRNSPAPIGSRNRFEKLNGEVPAIKKKFNMTEADYRDYLSVQQLSVSDAVKRQQLLDLMWKDVKRAGDAPLKQIDRMVLEGLSTGQITVTTTNNPDGIITDAIDLLMPTANKKYCQVAWGTSATSKPLDDIKTVVLAGQAAGIKFAKILMRLEVFFELVNSDDTAKLLGGFYRLGSGQKRIGTLDEINAMLTAWQFPSIEIVNESIGIEKDGAITASNPFVDDVAVFIPDGNLGEIKNALSIEQLRPVDGVVYAESNRVLISKWSTNDPFGEWTCGELNAFPALEAIDSIYILDTNSTSA